MNKTEFLQQLHDGGMSDPTKLQGAMDQYRQLTGKTFDDDQPPTPEQPPTNWVPGGVGGVATRALQGAGNVVKGLGQFVTGVPGPGQSYPAPGSIESTALDIGKAMGQSVMQPQTMPSTGMGLLKGVGSTLGNLPGVVGNLVSVVSPPAGRAINQVITPGEAQSIYQPTPEQQQGFQLGSELTNAGLMALPTPKIPGIQTITKIPDIIAGKLASSLSEVPEATLRAATTKEGRTNIAAQAGNEANLGDQVVNKLHDAYNQIPKAGEIKAALQDLPDVNVNDMVDKLTSTADKYRTPEMKAVGKKMTDMAQSLDQLADRDGNVSPSHLYDFRKELDQTLQGTWGGEAGQGAYINSLKDLRSDIKNSLLDAADGTQYQGLMQDAATKLDAIDKMKDMIGGSAQKQAVNAEGFMKNIMNANKTKKQEFLQNFQDVFETPDFLSQAKNAQMARQLGEAKGGAPGWLSQSSTGKSALGPVLDLATSGHIGPMTLLSSPMLSTRFTLPMTQTLGRLGVPMSNAAQAGYINQLNPYMNLGNLTQQQQ